MQYESVSGEWHGRRGILAVVLSLNFVLPMPLRSRVAPFDSPEWIFELKYDGFRALANIAGGRCELISRNGHPFSAFHALEDSIGGSLRGAGTGIIDGEIVCLDATGRPQFNDLLFHRGEPYFLAFDLVVWDRTDLRGLPLLRRKASLQRMLQGAPRECGIIAVGHVESCGTALFQQVRAFDLEGIVAKSKCGRYVAERERSTWFKIRNPAYSQIVGREKLFERDRHREPAPGWHTCDLACVEAELAIEIAGTG